MEMWDCESGLVATGHYAQYAAPRAWMHRIADTAQCTWLEWLQDSASGLKGTSPSGDAHCTTTRHYALQPIHFRQERYRGDLQPMCHTHHGCLRTRMVEMMMPVGKLRSVEMTIRSDQSMTKAYITINACTVEEQQGRSQGRQDDQKPRYHDVVQGLVHQFHKIVKVQCIVFVILD